MHFLFAYGSLLDPVIQEKLFKRTLTSEAKAVLLNWEKFTHEEYPFISPKKGSQVQGEILVLADKELGIADQWEEVPKSYQREKLEVKLTDGSQLKVWVYIKKPGN
ncbi:MAG: gamma-glutamylcyclotransferase [Bacteroidetes bacterium]|nr:MAG: gamma-glutamylcyclotransferase [Bacteroidota bacterium]